VWSVACTAGKTAIGYCILHFTLVSMVISGYYFPYIL